VLDRPRPTLEWVTDVLGEPYESTTLTLPDDDEGPVVATLVRRRAPEPTTRAVLYIHGFVDYFFQTHLADHFVDAGFDFYALDLRKYGRSLRPHQTPHDITSLADYALELDAAAGIIREVDGHEVFLVNGHSMGGLVAALWCHYRAGERLVQGLFLNSPFLSWPVSWVQRNVEAPAVLLLARVWPRQRVQFYRQEHYVQSIHTAWKGAWTFHLPWKQAEPFPVRAGWAAAVHRGLREVAKGLAIDAPILVMASTSSVRPRAWDDVLHTADAVINAEDVARLAPRLGRHVTVVRIAGGVHDLCLSGEAARAQVFADLDRWIAAYLPR
jgi:alpha-beta hydrolase superfamily lysophospholipase